ncbi:MAG: hypothetical protein FD126_21 [Elusimicrobia bacterium]|nr:MAG: hypothetical protein FD126_21 [Elusimicrobiota bacterium]
MLAKNADRARGRFALSGVLLSALLSLPFQTLSAAVSITDIKGTARVRRPNVASWNEVPVNYVLSSGDEVKTDRSSRVTISFDDASRVEIGPNSSYMLEETQPASSRMTLNFGKLKAWVTKASSRRFAVRTPTAVCSVRGTEFGVDVGQDGRTSVELFTGQLGVQDNKGNEILLNPGDRIDVSLTGLGRKENQESKKADESSSERAQIKKEVGLEMNKEQILAAAADEIKQALFQQGKVMTDVNGNRVRIEEYILRPTPTSFKFVVLNERPDRFDYFFRTGEFNTTLPDDLATALRQLPGCIGAQCTWWLTGFQTAWSNTQDVVLETASGGHMVDVNNNADGDDNVTKAFDPAVNDFVTLPAATPFFTTLFDTYSLKFNNVVHTSWVSAVGNFTGVLGTGIQSMGGTDGAGDNRTVTNVVNLVSAPNCATLDECTGNREPGKFHDIIYRKNGAGTIWDKFDNYIIDDNGKIANHSDFANITNGADYKRRLLDWNYQQIITASEFGGRKIDLVFEPKILMQSGLIQ